MMGLSRFIRIYEAEDYVTDAPVIKGYEEGCGCCSSEETFYSAETSIREIDDLIADLEEQIKELKKLKRKAKKIYPAERSEEGL